MTARDFQTQLADHATIQRTVEALRARNIDALVAESSEEAREKLIRMIPEGAEVFKSTSDTLDTIGYSDYLRQSARYKDLHAAVTAEPDHAQQRELRRLSTVAEYFIGSVHAIAETGEVVIASGSGSQLGAYVYGAKHVIWVAGVQKICPTLSNAVARVRGYALERHDQWLEERGRPAAPIGKLLIFENEQAAGRVSLILVKENLGW
jgi:L-lactate utilization protein LutC